MGLLRTLIRYLATPVFFGLAIVNVTLDQASGQSMSEMMGMGPPRPVVIAGGLTLPPDAAAALQSMWLMYLLMGVFHAGAWLELLRAKPQSRRASVPSDATEY